VHGEGNLLFVAVEKVECVTRLKTVFGENIPSYGKLVDEAIARCKVISIIPRPATVREVGESYIARVTAELEKGDAKQGAN